MSALAWSYALLHHSHTRIDMLYNRLPARGKAAVDVIGALLGFFPLYAIFAIGAGKWAIMSWEKHEVSVFGIWFPSMAPFRIAVLSGFILLILQGMAEFARDLYLLLRNRRYD